MNEMFELEGASLTVHLPGDVDHPVSDEIRRESDPDHEPRIHQDHAV